MLHALRNTFRKFRIVLGALRNGIYGFALVCAAWIFILPPSQTEIARLELPQNNDAELSELAVHRMAKLLTVVGTDRIFELVAARSDTGITADEVRLNILIAAEGRRVPAGQELQTATQADNGLEYQTGAKFVAARTN